jgi:Tol biopolymer transport system component
VEVIVLWFSASDPLLAREMAVLLPVHSKSLRPLLLALLPLALLFCLIACGGSNGGSALGGGTPTTIAYSSYRALDGSDAPNSDQPDGLTPVSNIWTIESDGTGSVAITQLSGSASGADSLFPQWSPDGSKIVYSSGRALDGSDNAAMGGAINIWVTNADGSGATPLTQLTVYALCWQPVWSPDGNKIAYYSWRALNGSDTNPGDNSPRNIWVMNADGSNDIPVTQLTAGASDSYFPQWSPDSKILAFYSSRALNGSNGANGQDATQNIWVVNSDGSGAAPVTQLTGQLGGFQGAYWTEDGSTLLFGDGANIWTAHPDGSGLTETLIGGNAFNFPTAWSSNDSTILFNSTEEPDGSHNSQQSSNVWIMNADGSHQTPLTKLSVAAAAEGLWSPDGTRIAYVSVGAFDGSDNLDANPAALNVWLMKADVSGAVPLTKLTKADSNGPVWKP